MPILKIGIWRLRQAQKPVQGHTANKWPSQKPTPSPRTTLSRTADQPSSALSLTLQVLASSSWRLSPGVIVGTGVC